MTTEQAIKLMLVEATCIERASNADHPCTRECEKCDLLQKSEDLFSAYGMAVSALRAQQERENQKPQWISVKNRLPNKNQYVLGYFTEMDGTSMAMRIIPGQNVNERGAIGGYGATHWMPLPEPPKERMSHEQAKI